jgi:DnaJ-domain-containing protein 1
MPRPVVPAAKVLAPEESHAVVDYYALLSEPRHPWIDLEQLKNRFIESSTELHPDRVHGKSSEEKQAAQARYTEINGAYQCLLQPRDRLAHLLELESGRKPAAIQTAPAPLMNLFLEVGELCREVDKFLEEKRAARSPLLLVSLFEHGQGLADKINLLQQRLRQLSAENEAGLRKQNRIWEKAPPLGDSRRVGALPLAELEEYYRAFSYVSRWCAQLQERLVQLAL